VSRRNCHHEKHEEKEEKKISSGGNAATNLPMSKKENRGQRNAGSDIVRGIIQ